MTQAINIDLGQITPYGWFLRKEITTHANVLEQSRCSLARYFASTLKS